MSIAHQLMLSEGFRRREERDDRKREETNSTHCLGHDWLVGNYYTVKGRIVSDFEDRAR